MGAGVGRESDDETGDETGVQRSVEAGGDRAVAAGGDIGQAITGDGATVNFIGGGTYNAPVIMARNIGKASTGPQYTGDHYDFRDANFNDKVVANETNYTENNYYGNVPAAAEWRPAADIEPWELGVSATRHIPGQPDVPPYVPRDCDDDLRAKLARSGLVLILGERYAGKSYTAWHGVRSLDGHVFYAPDHGEDLRHLLAALRGKPGKYVVWLDELTDHLGEGGLEPRLLGKLTGLGAVVLGTMRPREYYERRSGTAPGDRVVATARTVQLPREWSEDELGRLAESDDPRAYPAYMWSGKEGAASYFAVGHLLFDEWQREGTRAEHPRGRLLVRAAVDLARCGVTGAVPVQLLRALQEEYGTEEGESFEDALAWATTPMFGTSGLLVQGEEAGTWRAYGALVAEALRSDDLEPVPDRVWWVSLVETKGAPEHAGLADAAYAALRPRIEAGDVQVAFRLGVYMGGDEGEALVRGAAEAGYREAQTYLARRLLKREDEQAALPYLERAARDGDSWAARRLGQIHRDRAQHWLTQAAEAGDGEAAHVLGEMLLGTGGGEPLRLYVKAVKAGHKPVATSLGRALSYRGNKKDAEFWLRRGAELDDPGAVHSLAVFLHRLGGHEAEAEELYRRAEELGHPAASRNLGNLLLRTGAVDEAVELLRQDAARGSGEAAYWLSKHLRKQGNEEEADDWLLEAAELDHYYAMRRLGQLPVFPGDQPDTVEE
ncbi:sel1 repeat family protein [Streptomyces ipomoeae]|jgi:TPR repeat protein|uniref:Sel1 repeat family protein n=1 Tax=Streptomyces ipomoeae TaxID=103232 RepID=A0AAE9AW69_9ACTN|nr:tetratricopeptide repeat protein [Streptomyces ipomoeae]MDX2697371.1 tetratricopeptide repeat protein [Streptomyces ipomoeae]MDX2823979.1 tetratricopeptide repeat protein [Streptomyces ipomoeae]MDX2841372.1 tetratricopeptide repeat protein [Streptomyces ipomoeae]MDX2877473.1 tetratricopeptide repeat protein [Streptomyces ipomoeae]TQE16316.1 sel1 repeat family protein [Streptomyces ipomoeae]